MKRYLLFTAQNDCCMRECSQFGWNAFRDSFDSYIEAFDAFGKHPDEDHGQIVDLESAYIWNLTK